MLLIYFAEVNNYLDNIFDDNRTFHCAPDPISVKLATNQIYHENRLKIEIVISSPNTEIALSRYHQPLYCTVGVFSTLWNTVHTPSFS